MEKILKESFIYRFLLMIKKWFDKQVETSVFMQLFLTDSNQYKSDSSMIVGLFEWFLKKQRMISKRLKLDKIFDNSIFAKPLFWASVAIAIAPIAPTMFVLVLALASILSLLLKASIDESFTFKHYRLNGWVIAFAIVIAISSVISISVTESIKIALLMITFVLFYFVVINVVTTKKQLKMVLYIISSVAVMTAIYGIYQYYYGSLYSMAWIDEDMFEGIRMRVYSTLENPNVYGEFLLLVIPYTIGLLWTEKGWKRKVFLLGAVGLMSIVLILTFSRGCWLGIIFAIAILALIINRKFIFLGLILILVAPFFLPDAIVDRFLSIGNMEDSSTSYRVYIWMGTLAMLKDYWISGVGMGISSFNTIYPLYSYNNIPAPHSHNLYLQIIVEYGIVGFIVFIGIIYQYFKNVIISLKTKKNILLGGLLCGMIGFLLESMTDHTWYNYRVVFLFWVFIGLTTVASRLNMQDKELEK